MRFTKLMEPDARKRVPQDSKDEPARMLLERVRNAKSTAKGGCATSDTATPGCVPGYRGSSACATIGTATSAGVVQGAARGRPRPVRHIRSAFNGRHSNAKRVTQGLRELLAGHWQSEMGGIEPLEGSAGAIDQPPLRL